MHQFLSEFVRTCLECQQCKRPIHPIKPPVGTIPVAAPCTRWNLDFHGSYPTDSQGKKFILTFICCTSGWPELIATSDTSAGSVVQAIHDHIVCRYGLCRSLAIKTDCGSAFISQLTKLYCQTFAVKQTFSSPYTPQSNVRVESFADIIHKSLRLVCEDHRDWSKHLQSVAWAYRASATTNLILAPFEVVFGRKMEMAIDHSMGIPEQVVGSPEMYASEIGPKLKILHQVAVQNAIESGDRHRASVNKNATLPNLTVGSKILLYDSTTKTGESSKLKVRYSEPYTVTEIRPGYKYMLQHVHTGKNIKRPVHISRMRPLYERCNDTPVNTENNDEYVREYTRNERLKVRIVIGDATKTNTDGIVCFLNKQLQPVGEVSKVLIQQGGTLVREILNNLTKDVSTIALASVLVTPVSELSSQKLFHVVVDEADAKRTPEIKNLLERALPIINIHATSITFPFPGLKDLESQPWPVAQLFVDGLVEFCDNVMDSNTQLRTITFVCDSLLIADVMSTVCRNVLDRPRTTDAQTSSTNANDLVTYSTVDNGNQNQTVQPPDNNEWYTVKEVLRQRMYKGKRQYLVRWESTDTTDWVNRTDLSDTAVEHFHATHPRRRRRRQC